LNNSLKLNKDIQKRAQQTLLQEATALQGLANSIDNQFTTVVEQIHQNSGRLVITGIGKSGIIAQKISATLNSTGTPALFLHAADAIHGDLGMVQQDDIVLCISKSGNSPEIKALIPFIHKGGNLVIGMTADPQSFLGQHSDYCLHTPVAEEACPNNLAPTTSTTLQLALGDALAVCLLEMKDFSAQDFAKYHPGGSLGKKLYLTLQDMVDSESKPQLHPLARLEEVILEITSKRLGAAVVLEDGVIKGLITDGDLRRMLKEHDNIQELQAKDIMTPDPMHMPASTLAVEALSVIEKRQINHIVVTDADEKYLGIVHVLDFLNQGIN